MEELKTTERKLSAPHCFNNTETFKKAQKKNKDRNEISCYIIYLSK